MQGECYCIMVVKLHLPNGLFAAIVVSAVKCAMESAILFAPSYIYIYI